MDLVKGKNENGMVLWLTTGQLATLMVGEEK